MKKQTKADKMDESLGMRRGKESTKKQSMASRRHESEGMEPISVVKSRVKTKHAARMAGIENLKGPGGRVHRVKMKVKKK